MKTRRWVAKSFLRLWMLASCLAIGLALLPEGVASADNCPYEPWNLADCLRTPGYREWYVTGLVAFGVMTTLIAQILAEASKTSLTDQDVNKFIQEQILERMKHWMQSGVARQVGADLAPHTADILDNWEKDNTAIADTTTPAPRPKPQSEPTDIYLPGEIVSGPKAKDFLTKTGALDKLSLLRKGAGWQKIIQAMNGDPGMTSVTNFSVEWNDDGTPNLDNLVFVMPETTPAPVTTVPQPEPEEAPEPESESAPAEEEKPEEKPKEKKPAKVNEKPPPEEVKPPPPAETPPPDLRELRDRAIKERSDAQKKIQNLTDKKRELAEKLKEKEKEWNYTRVKGFWGGIWDIIDVVTDISSVKRLETSTFGGAYVKDLAKSAIKALCTELHADGIQPSDLKKIGIEDAITPTGVVPSSIYNPQGPGDILDHVMPGGGIKQLIQNTVKTKPGGETINKIYGPGETVVKGTREVIRAKEKCEALRAEMSQLRDQLSDVRSQMEDAEMAFDVADSSVKHSQANIDQLKEMFPNRFRNL